MLVTSRRSWVALAAAAVVTGTLSTAAVQAQGGPCLPATDPGGSSTTTTTSAPPDGTGSTTTVPCPTTTAPPTTLPPVTAPAPSDEPASPPSPPGATTTLPTTTTTIEEPPVHLSGHYADQPELTRRTTPDYASVNAARGRRNQAAAMLESAVGAVTTLEQAVIDREEAVGALAAAEQEKADELLTATEDFEERVVDAYVRGLPAPLSVLEGSEEIADVLSKIVMLEQVLAEDQASLGRVEQLREDVGDAVAELVQRLHEVRGELTAARDWVGQASAIKAETDFEVDVWEANSDVYVKGFFFPVAADYSFIDSWGFPRATGTPAEHWHEGADIFAPTGTELVAVETGVISRLSDGGLGGRALYIEGQSGSKHYYAHLTGYAEGIEVGTIVTGGDVVGYVGDSGNARGGTPHLHYEIHPGDRPVNPYPILATAVQRDAEVLRAVAELDQRDATPGSTTSANTSG